MIKNATKTVTSIILYSSLLLFGANIYAADAPFQSNPVLPSQGDDETPMYLRILLNRTFGLRIFDGKNLIADQTRNDEISSNLTRALIFLNPSDVNYIFASTKMIGANTAGGAPWWFNQQFDVLPQDNTNPNVNANYPANPTIQSIQNSLHIIYDKDDCYPGDFNQPDCISQLNYKENRVNLVMDGSNNIDPGKIKNLSISSLLDPLQYDQTTGSQQEDAENFIRLISGALDFTPDPSYGDVLEEARDGSDIAKKALADYNSKIFSGVARTSVINGNFEFLLSRRISNPDNNKSIKQLEHDMVMSRIDPDGVWKKNLENQSLNATMKDIAGLLAELQAQSYLRGEENERLIASFSTLLIQQQEFAQLTYFLDSDDF